MATNTGFALQLAFYLFVLLLTIIVGAIITIVMEIWPATSMIKKKSRMLIQIVSTLLITSLLTLLVIWKNIDVLGKLSWLGGDTQTTNLPSNTPTSDLGSS